jgi:hypothetical protein
LGRGAFSIVKSGTSLLFAAFRSMCGPLYVQLYRGKLQGPERNHPHRLGAFRQSGGAESSGCRRHGDIRRNEIVQGFVGNTGRLLVGCLKSCCRCAVRMRRVYSFYGDLSSKTLYNVAYVIQYGT